MFLVNKQDISKICHDFGLPSEVIAFSELQRYHYENEDPASRQVRLIVRADLAGGQSVVVRFKNEEDVTPELVEAQSGFQALLRENGIITPAVFKSDGAYARLYLIHGYEVIVTVEAFAEGEVREVGEHIAEQTGSLLARMHNIAEANDVHVENAVLFDPLRENDLFRFSDFERHQEVLRSVDEPLYREIVKEYEKLMERIRVMKGEPKYAVQGDISNCNLYLTDGEVGIFDFNRCGDNVLCFDAVMQAVFEARLMDYPKTLEGKQENAILSAFLRGYHRERPFTERQRETFPYLYALISAFWRCSLVFDEDSLVYAVEAGDRAAVQEWMKEIRRRLLSRPEMPL